MNGEGGIFGFVNRVGDLIILNLLFLVTCIPIVTIGPSLVALYTVMLKLAKNQEGYAVRGYLKAFRDNVKQSLLVGVSLEIILAILGYDAWALMQTTESYNSAGFVVTVLAVLIISAAMQYLFPLMARYDNKIRISIKNALLLAISKLPYTVMLLALAVIPVGLILISWYLAIYAITIGCALSAFLQCKILNKIFYSIENK